MNRTVCVAAMRSDDPRSAHSSLRVNNRSSHGEDSLSCVTEKKKKRYSFCTLLATVPTAGHVLFWGLGKVGWSGPGYKARPLMLSDQAKLLSIFHARDRREWAA